MLPFKDPDVLDWLDMQISLRTRDLTAQQKEVLNRHADKLLDSIERKYGIASLNTLFTWDDSIRAFGGSTSIR